MGIRAFFTKLCRGQPEKKGYKTPKECEAEEEEAEIEELVALDII